MPENAGDQQSPADQGSTETPRVQPTDPQANDNDLQLVRRAIRGDGKAFHALVDAHSQRLYRLAVSLVGNATDAEDVLQETFAGAFRGLAGFQGRSSVKTWLTRILVTQAAKWRRDRQRRSMPSSDEIEMSQADSAAASIGAKIDLQAALQLLSQEHREVLVLREFEGMSYDEIAEAIGLPRGTVESRLHRARAELKEKLKAYLP
jgi:RNA polymerase sigma-70 factor (ECF subfamily)